MSGKMSILLIEDNAADAYLFQAALTDIGADAEVNAFEHGTEAWEYVCGIGARGNKKLDLVILDMNLPGMNGRDILHEIANNEHLRNLPVAVFSGAADESVVAQEYPHLRIMFATKTYLYDELKDTLARAFAFAAGVHGKPSGAPAGKAEGAKG